MAYWRIPLLLRHPRASSGSGIPAALSTVIYRPNINIRLNGCLNGYSWAGSGMVFATQNNGGVLSVHPVHRYRLVDVLLQVGRHLCGILKRRIGNRRQLVAVLPLTRGNQSASLVDCKSERWRR